MSESAGEEVGGVDLTTRVGAVELRNPVLMASGTFGYGSEFAPFLDLTALGGFVAKSLTLEPRFGNPPPRIAVEACERCVTILPSLRRQQTKPQHLQPNSSPTARPFAGAKRRRRTQL